MIHDLNTLIIEILRPSQYNPKIVAALEVLVKNKRSLANMHSIDHVSQKSLIWYLNANIRSFLHYWGNGAQTQAVRWGREDLQPCDLFSSNIYIFLLYANSGVTHTIDNWHWHWKTLALQNTEITKIWLYSTILNNVCCLRQQQTLRKRNKRHL